MARHLLEHVVEEADARGDRHRIGRVEVDGDVDVGLPRAARDAAAACRAAGQAMPRAAASALASAARTPQSLDAEPRRELEVGRAIADDPAACAVDRLARDVAVDQPRRGLAAVAAVLGAVRAEQDVVEGDALRLEHLQQQPLRTLEARRREGLGAEPVLVRHHHEPVAGVAQAQQRGNDARQEAQLLEGVDLLVGRLLDQGAVAVDEERRGGVGS